MLALATGFRERARVVERAERDLINLAQSLSISFAETITAARAGLSPAVVTAARTNDTDLRDALLQDAVTELNGSFAVILRDAATGSVQEAVFAEGETPVDNGLLAEILADPTPSYGLFDDPVALPDGRMKLPLRMRSVDGRLEVVMLIKPDYFLDIFARLVRGEDVAALLATTDGTVLARYPDIGITGESLADKTLFTALQTSTYGSFLAPRQSDGRSRLTGFAVVDEFDFVVATAYSRSDVMTPFRPIFTLIAMITLVLLLGIGGLFAVMLRAQTRMVTLVSTAHAAQTRAERFAQYQQAITLAARLPIDAPTLNDYLGEIARLLRHNLHAEQCLVFEKASDEETLHPITGNGSGISEILANPVHRKDASAFERAADSPNTLVRISAEEISDPARKFLIARKLGAHTVGMIAVDTGIARRELVFCLYFPRVRTFSTQERYFISTVADTVATHYRTRLEESLRAAAFDNIGGSMTVVNNRGAILAVNKAWLEFGDGGAEAAAERWSGLNYLSVCDRSADDGMEDATIFAQGLRSVLAGVKPVFIHEYEMDIPVSSSSGGDWSERELELRWFRSVVTPVALDDGLGAIILHFDVTDQRRIEDQLRESQRMDAIGMLTGGVAHDFNNLLTIISGNAELLEDLPDASDTVRDRAGTILQAADRGVDLTDKLLAFARRRSLSKETVDPVEVIENLDTLLRRTLPENIEFNTAVQPGTPCVLTDSSVLETAILNLVVNARDALRGNGVISVNVHAVNNAKRRGSFVVFQVSDNGHGMSAAVKSRIFEPFYTTKEVGSGTGLGLSMVHGFAAQSGGFVDVESTEGVGTTFHLALPATPSAGDTLPRALSDEGDDLSRMGVGLKAMVVEDEPDLRKLLVLTLESVGFEVLAAGNGQEAFAHLDRHDDFALLVTDFVLPGGHNGRDIAREVARRQPDCSAVIVSGYPAEVERDGDDDATSEIPVVGKPFRKENFLRTVKRVLSVGAKPAVDADG